MPVRNAIGTAIAVLAISAALPACNPALALGHDSYMGQVGLVSATYCPKGTFEADGRVLDVDRLLGHRPYLLGNRFGGDVAQKTLALPDLRNKAPLDGLRYCFVLDGTFPQQN